MPRPAPRRQRGLSLVELMIALVLGLVVVAAVFNVHAGTSRSQRFTGALQTLQENGRFGLSTLRRGLRLAGFSNDPDFDPFVLADSGDSRIVVRAERPHDCNGGDTATATTAPGVAIDTYALDTVRGAITCAGNVATTPTELVENVEAFRVLYGVDADGDGVPERFVRRVDVADPGSVAALRVGLLVSSGEPVRSRARAEEHVVLGDVLEPDPDRLLREVFATTVRLENNLRGRF